MRALRAYMSARSVAIGLFRCSFSGMRVRAVNVYAGHCHARSYMLDRFLPPVYTSLSELASHFAGKLSL